MSIAKAALSRRAVACKAVAKPTQKRIAFSKEQKVHRMLSLVPGNNDALRRQLGSPTCTEPA
jgi:hypothetical protein